MAEEIGIAIGLTVMYLGWVLIGAGLAFSIVWGVEHLDRVAPVPVSAPTYAPRHMSSWAQVVEPTLFEQTAPWGRVGYRPRHMHG